MFEVDPLAGTTSEVQSMARTASLTKHLKQQLRGVARSTIFLTAHETHTVFFKELISFDFPSHSSEYLFETRSAASLLLLRQRRVLDRCRKPACNPLKSFEILEQATRFERATPTLANSAAKPCCCPPTPRLLSAVATMVSTRVFLEFIRSEPDKNTFPGHIPDTMLVVSVATLFKYLK